MRRNLRRVLLLALLFGCSLSFPLTPAACAQDGASAPLRQVRAEGEQHLKEDQIVALTALAPGNQIGKQDLQSAADKLVATGLFAKVNYNFSSKIDGVYVTYHVEENPRLPVYFDNIPWLADSELNDSIRKKLPFYDGTLPAAGGVVEEAASAVKELLAARGMNVELQHQVYGDPVGDGDVQEFHIEGPDLKIAKVEFSDASLLENKTVRVHLGEIQGKPYSRATIDLFLAEQIRPIYLEQGYLRAKLGPPEVRLVGNPNQKLPEQIPVFVPIDRGQIYHRKSVSWSGNSLLSTITLDGLVAFKPGEVADGVKIEGAWEKVREEYGRRGCLEAKVTPAPSYDDAAHTVSYSVAISEGPGFKLGKVVITGLSVAAERKLRDDFPVVTGTLFDKGKFEALLTNLETHKDRVFGDMPLHYETVGHWLQTDPGTSTVDVLLDFK
jgi:outer membrane protein insertion porin family